MKDLFAPTSLRGGRRRPWQDLPPELLGLVIQRIPSHAGRVRLRAACRSWRAGARMQPPLLPLLLQRDDTLLSLPDGAVHRIPIPDDVSYLMSTTGSMLFLVHDDGRCSVFNPFSPGMAPQCVDADCFSFLISPPEPIVCNLRKVVIMSDYIVTIRRIYNRDNNSVLAICGRRQPRTTVDIRWTPPVVAHSVDAALFQEKLYVLAATTVGTIDLCAMDLITDGHVSLQRVISVPKDNPLPLFGHVVHHYLVASGDRLLMVRQDIDRSNPMLVAAQFEVFQALDLISGPAQWRKVDTLMGRAIFLSAGCSESLEAGDQYAGAQEDCIYFLSELGNGGFRKQRLSSGIYNMRERTLSPLPFEAVVTQEGPGIASWLFSSNT
ncbi:hypothetical protein ACQ4PT_064672 [Festuca glaucescens]